MAQGLGSTQFHSISRWARREMLTRRAFVKTLGVGAATALASNPLAAQTRQQPAYKNNGAARNASPNMVWISLEDITPMMGCYGDQYARTPVFDSLAAEGIRYTRAHSAAPVCSPSRSSVITGMYPGSPGTMHHRSRARASKFLKMLPNLLRRAGYYISTSPPPSPARRLTGKRVTTAGGRAPRDHQDNRGDPKWTTQLHYAWR